MHCGANGEEMRGCPQSTAWGGEGRRETSPSTLLALMQCRKCYPKIGHLGILSILSWKKLRKPRHQKGHADHLPPNKAGHRNWNSNCPFLPWDGLGNSERSLSDFLPPSSPKGLHVAGILPCIWRAGMLHRPQRFWTNRPCSVHPVYYHQILPCCPSITLPRDCP